MPELPTLPSGKIDRAALPTPSLHRSARVTPFVEPIDRLEELLVEVWRAVTGVDAVGTHDDFFGELGGHSLLAARLAARLRSVLDTDVPLQLVFDAPTIVAMAVGAPRVEPTRRRHRWRGRDRRRRRRRRTRHRRRPRAGSRTCPRLISSPARQARATVPSHAPTGRTTSRCRSPSNACGSSTGSLPATRSTSRRRRSGSAAPSMPRALEMSLGAVADRHEVLRTSFANVDGRPLQRIAPSTRVPLELVDLAVVAPARRDDELDRIVLERATTPFDLTTLPAAAGDPGAARPRTTTSCVLAMHHIITDGWSMQVFGRELSILYRCLVTGERVELPELPIQYADYAIWQRSDERSAAVERQLGYWQEHLAGLSIVELPTDHPRPATFSYRGGDERFVIPAGVCARLTEFARGERVTTFMVGFAVWASLLARYADQTDIVVGVPIAGRDRPELEHLVGCFLNNLVVRVDLADDPTFRELVARTRDVVVGAFAHQDVPFERLVEELQPVRDLARHPLFQVMFQYFDTDGATGAPHDHVAVRRTTAILDLFLHLWDDGGAIRGKIEYCSDLFDPATVRAMAHQYVVLTRAAIDAPDTPVSRLPIVTSADRAELAELAVGPDLVVDGPLTLADLWDGQVARTRRVDCARRGRPSVDLRRARRPRAARSATECSPEVSHPGRWWACASSDPSTRSRVELAIVTLGGAWVALDPSSPQRVLDHILADSGASMVVTASRHADRIAGTTTVVHVDDAGDVSNRARAIVRCGHAPDDIACLIYTSGSTGHPKGVMVEHRGIHNRLAWMWQAFPFEAGEVMALKTAPSFVDSIWETFGPAARRRSGRDAARATRRAIHAAGRRASPPPRCHPAARRAVAAAGAARQRARGRPRAPRLERWFTSGEVLHARARRAVRRVRARGAAGQPLRIVGGRRRRDRRHRRRRGPAPPVTIGRPIANTTLHILDDRGRAGPGRRARPDVRRPARTSRAATAADPRSPRRRSSPTRSRDGPGRACTTPATERGGASDGDDGVPRSGRPPGQAARAPRRARTGRACPRSSTPASSQAAVAVTDAAADRRTSSSRSSRATPTPPSLRAHARRRLAEPMVPDHVRARRVSCPAAERQDRPLGPRRRRRCRPCPAASTSRRRPRREQQMAEMWRELLDVERVGVDGQLLRRSAATRCWRPGSSRSCGDDSASRCRSRGVRAPDAGRDGSRARGADRRPRSHR